MSAPANTARSMEWPHLLLTSARLASASLAAVVGVVALRAYLGGRRRSILRVALAALMLAFGYFIEGVLVETEVLSLHSANAFEAATTLVALILLVSSLYVRDPIPTRHA